MGRDELKARIEKIRGYNDLLGLSEAQAKKSIIEPICECLDWDISDLNEAMLEYKMPSGDRVDYALLNNNKLLILLEAKRPKESLDNHQEQLLKYAFSLGTPLAVLTNGIHWWLYLPISGGRWEERKFDSIDIYAHEIDSICDRFNEFLSKENVISGSAVDNAKKMRKSREAKKKIEATLPKVWEEISNESSERHIELMIEKTEEKCGVKPSEQQAKDFIAKITHPVEPLASPIVNSNSKKAQQGTSLTGRPYWEDKATRDTVALCDDILELAPFDCILNFNNKHDIPLMKNGRKFAICKPIKESFKLGVYQSKNGLFESQLIEVGLREEKEKKEGWRYVRKKGFYYIYLSKKLIDEHKVFLTKILKATYNKASK